MDCKGISLPVVQPPWAMWHSSTKFDDLAGSAHNIHRVTTYNTMKWGELNIAMLTKFHIKRFLVIKYCCLLLGFSNLFFKGKNIGDTCETGY